MTTNIPTARAGATELARAVQTWADPTRDRVAAFSLGACVAFMLAGAPRLVVAVALVPAIAVAATGGGRDGRTRGRALEDARFDREALDRAADEGMGTVPRDELPGPRIDAIPAGDALA